MKKRAMAVSNDLTEEQRAAKATEILQEAMNRIRDELHIDVTPMVQENTFIRNGIKVREEWAIIALSPRQE